MRRPPQLSGRTGLSRRDFVRAAALSLPLLGTAGSRLASAQAPEASGAALLPPPVPAGKRHRVVVIGAGLAGLSAAHELAAWGHEVTVLEASQRAGGRVHTLREGFADGLYAEAGAISLSEGFHHFLRWVKAFSLDAVSPSRAGLRPLYHLRGRRLEITPGTPADWPFDLTPEERKLGILGMIQTYFAPVERMGDPALPEWQLAPFEDFDRMTLADFLKSQGASAEAVTLLGDALWFGHGWSTGSALHRLVSDVALFYMGQATLVLQGGTDLLPQAFARGLRDRIRYATPVVEIRQEPGKVLVDCLQAGQAERLEAERVICTVPVPALRRIGFTPGLSPAKRQAVDGLEYSPVVRIYLQSRRRFWAEAGCAGNAGTDLPIRLVAEHPAARAAGLGSRSILECHLKGEHAQEVAGLDDGKLLLRALDSMEKVHPGFRANYEGGTVARWADGPWSGGAYPFWKPGQITAWQPELRRPEGPEGRVHFAGEHTSILSRTMEGALESGSRAAREVHAASG